MNKKIDKQRAKFSAFSTVRRSIITVGFLGLILFLAIWFMYAIVSAWRVQTSAHVSCTFDLSPKLTFSYVQYNIKDQGTEPLFNGSIFINLGDLPTSPSPTQVMTSAARNYGNTITDVQFFKDEKSKTVWMAKEAEGVSLYRVSGSQRDFPFDSANIDFDTTFTPALSVRLLILRNFNTSFYIPCDSAAVTKDDTGKIHASFELRRNPIVKLMAILMLIAATLFVAMVPFTVKREALPTTVASFFFSIWSIRGILSSEMKVFPTRLDILILSLSVLLLLLLGIRILVGWIRPTNEPA